MIFVDFNMPMYLVGAAHPHKTGAQILLERLIESGERLVIVADRATPLYRYRSRRHPHCYHGTPGSAVDPQL